jgi:hypothetical protein
MDNLLKLAIEAHGGLERWRQFNIASHTRNQISRISALTDCCGGTNIPSMSLAMLRDSTTPPTTEPQTDLWCHKRRVFAYDSKKRKVAEPLLVAINIHEIDFN